MWWIYIQLGQEAQIPESQMEKSRPVAKSKLQRALANVLLIRQLIWGWAASETLLHFPAA